MNKSFSGAVLFASLFLGATAAQGAVLGVNIENEFTVSYEKEYSSDINSRGLNHCTVSVFNQDGWLLKTAEFDLFRTPIFCGALLSSGKADYLYLQTVVPDSNSGGSGAVIERKCKRTEYKTAEDGQVTVKTSWMPFISQYTGEECPDVP